MLILAKRHSSDMPHRLLNRVPFDAKFPSNLGQPAARIRREPLTDPSKEPSSVVSHWADVHPLGLMMRVKASVEISVAIQERKAAQLGHPEF